MILSCLLWRKYVAFADGEWLQEFVDDDEKTLLNKLNQSDEYKYKDVFYIKVTE